MDKDKSFIPKIKTNIVGLDKLLFGGLNLAQDHNVVIIRSEDVNQGTVLGIQMLYGLSQSIHRDSNKVLPYFISNHDDEKYLNDLLLDTTIASCIQRMIKKYVVTAKPKDGSLLNMKFGFSKTFFNIGKEDTDGIEAIDKKSDNIDIRICEEAIYYSNRTNSLHLRNLKTVIDGLADSDVENLLYVRKSDYYETFSGCESLSKELNFPLVPIEILSTYPAFYPSDKSGTEKNVLKLLEERINKETINFVTLDLAGINLGTEEIGELIEKVKAKCKFLLIIQLATCTSPVEKADMIIELDTNIPESTNSDNYIMRYVRISQSKNQATALGWHLYKYRDYGIEVYPSLHTYFQKRRYLQRALVNTHSSIVSDTYQQYLEQSSKLRDKENIDFDHYIAGRQNIEKQYVDALFTNYDIGYSSVDVLEAILIPRKSTKHVLDYQGSVTAIIGDSNTYKRFLTFGSIFSSSLDCDHTLIILLNKDAATIRRRLSCPARSKRGSDCTACQSCYKYIHFMDICMGNITADEFIYYLELQLGTPFDDGGSVKRVVIDDLQIVDFCFPFLKSSTLFLSALVAICREKGIQLFILCDKSASKVAELRAVSDNIICTGRNKQGKLQLYIERYIGFTNTPSKIYCGTVNKAKNLFECYYKVDEKKEKKTYFKLNSMQIDDDKVSSMKEYWE